MQLRSLPWVIAMVLALAGILGLLSRTNNPYLASYTVRVERSVVQPIVKKLSFKAPAAPEPEANQSLVSYLTKTRELLTPRGEEVALPQSVSFFAVGDIMLSRSVAREIDRAGDPLLPFSAMAPLLAETDFNFGNLESPFSGSSQYNPSGSMVFNVPPKNVSGLTASNFAVLNLANNHSLDQGVLGLEYTQKYLTDHGILYTGVGADQDAAWEPRVVEKNGIKIAFIGASYTAYNDGGVRPSSLVATISDTDHLMASVKKAKTLADFVVVTMHAGVEYTRNPNGAQIDFARAAVDAGADMVIGAHPHWIQTFERYNGKYIFYSLGNFVFDQMWSQDTREGLTLRISVGRPKLLEGIDSAASGTTAPVELTGLQLVPVVIDNFSTPRLASGTEISTILKKFGATTTVLSVP